MIQAEGKRQFKCFVTSNKSKKRNFPVLTTFLYVSKRPVTIQLTTKEITPKALLRSTTLHSNDSRILEITYATIICSGSEFFCNDRLVMPEEEDWPYDLFHGCLNLGLENLHHGSIICVNLAHVESTGRPWHHNRIKL